MKFPNHPIIDEPWTYRVVELTYNLDSDDHRDRYIDLILRRDSAIRRLRFLGASNLNLDPDAVDCWAGLCILDISTRQLEDYRIEVYDFEDGSGPSFLAREVIDLDDPA